MVRALRDKIERQAKGSVAALCIGGRYPSSHGLMLSSFFHLDSSPHVFANDNPHGSIFSLDVDVVRSAQDMNGSCQGCVPRSWIPHSRSVPRYGVKGGEVRYSVAVCRRRGRARAGMVPLEQDGQLARMFGMQPKFGLYRIDAAMLARTPKLDAEGCARGPRSTLSCNSWPPCRLRGLDLTAKVARQ